MSRLVENGLTIGTNQDSICAIGPNSADGETGLGRVAPHTIPLLVQILYTRCICCGFATVAVGFGQGHFDGASWNKFGGSRLVNSRGGMIIYRG